MAPKKKAVKKAPFVGLRGKKVCGHNGAVPVVIPAGWKMLKDGETIRKSHRVGWTNVFPELISVGCFAGMVYKIDRLRCECPRMVVIRKVVKRRGK